LSKLPKRISAEAVGKAILRNLRAATYDVWESKQRSWPKLTKGWLRYKRRHGAFTQILAYTGRTVRSIATGSGATRWEIVGRGSKSQIRLMTYNYGIAVTLRYRPWPGIYDHPKYVAAVKAGFYEALVAAGMPESAARGALVGAAGGAAAAIRKAGMSGLKRWRESGLHGEKAKAFLAKSSQLEKLKRRRPAFTRKRPITKNASGYVIEFKRAQENLKRSVMR